MKSETPCQIEGDQRTNRKAGKDANEDAGRESERRPRRGRFLTGPGEDVSFQALSASRQQVGPR
jgi:hypothetical protein